MNGPEHAQTPVDSGAVSVIMPILNEERHLRDAVAVVLDQDYPGEMELVLALGPSSDGTDHVAHALAEQDPRIICVPNPSGRNRAYPGFERKLLWYRALAEVVHEKSGS